VTSTVGLGVGRESRITSIPIIFIG
jgi:hypothetical protein